MFEALSFLGVEAVGTVRIDRFAKPPLLSEKGLMKKGRGAAYEITSVDGKLALVRWFHNRAVNMCSNFFSQEHLQEQTNG